MTQDLPVQQKAKAGTCPELYVVTNRNSLYAAGKGKYALAEQNCLPFFFFFHYNLNDLSKIQPGSAFFFMTGVQTPFLFS